MYKAALEIIDENTVVFRGVRVNRARTPQAMLNATGYRQQVVPLVVKTMPRNEGGDVTDVFFFKPPSEAYQPGGVPWLTFDLVAHAYESRNFKPDPFAQGAVNEAHPDFARDYPNSGHWIGVKHAPGVKFRDTLCYMLFFNGLVGIDDSAMIWTNEWFAGIPK